jgi:hypothetical protein
MRKKKLIVMALIMILALAFIYWCKGYMDVDKCLDGGGRWNYEKSSCEY